MSWAIVAVGAIGAIAGGTGSFMSSNAKDKAQQNALGAVKDKGSKAFGTVPQAAEYVPVDYDKTQLDAVLGNARNLPEINELTSAENYDATTQALQRVRRLVPGYNDLMRTYSAAGSDLMHMRLPFDDVLGTISDQNELANTLGIPGTAGPATMKDLGLSRMGALQAGGGILKDMVGMAETINPVERQDSPANWMVRPMDRIQGELQQHQLEQQSLQNKYNLAAAGDPATRAYLQLLVAQAGQANSPAGGALSSFGSILGGVVGGAGGMGGGGRGGNRGGFFSNGGGSLGGGGYDGYGGMPGYGGVYSTWGTGGGGLGAAASPNFL